MSPKASKKTTTPAARKLEVGDEVEAKCGKCKDITTHLVLAKIGWKPTRVECKTCNAAHEFRSPTAAKRKSAATKTGPTMAPEDHWKDCMGRAKGTPRAYASGDDYAIGTILQHSKFGDGVVTDRLSHTVCEVAFESGIIKLLMATRQSPAHR